MRVIAVVCCIIAVLYIGLIDNQRKAEFEAPFVGYVDVTAMGSPVLPVIARDKQPAPDTPAWLYLDHLGSRFVNPKALGSICPGLLQITLPGSQEKASGKLPLSHWLDNAEAYDRNELAQWANHSWGNMIRVEGLTIPMSSLPEPERCPWLSATKNGNIGFEGRHLVVLLKLRPAPVTSLGSEYPQNTEHREKEAVGGGGDAKSH